MSEAGSGFAGGAMALTAAALWAVSTTLFQGAIVRFGPRAMNLFRCMIALVLFWTTSLVLHGTSLFAVLPTRTGVLLLLSGALGLAVGDYFLFHALRVLGAQPAIALNQLSPVWSALLGLFLGLEQLGPQQYGAIGIVIVGVLLVVFGRIRTVPEFPELHPFTPRDRLIAVGAGTLSSLCNASAGMMTTRVIREVGAIQGSTLRMTGGAALLLFVSLVTRELRNDSIALRTIRRRGRELLAVFIATFVAIALQQAAFARIEASVALCLLSTTPIFLLPLAIGILRERYRWTAVLGTLVAMVGVPLLVV